MLKNILLNLILYFSIEPNKFIFNYFQVQKIFKEEIITGLYYVFTV